MHCIFQESSLVHIRCRGGGQGHGVEVKGGEREGLRVSPPPKHWKLCWKNLQPLFTTVGSHRRSGGWEREENNRACVPCLSQQRGELGQRGSVSPGPLKEGLLQLSVVVGWGQGRRAPGHREAKQSGRNSLVPRAPIRWKPSLLLVLSRERLEGGPQRR